MRLSGSMCTAALLAAACVSDVPSPAGITATVAGTTPAPAVSRPGPEEGPAASVVAGEADLVSASAVDAELPSRWTFEAYLDALRRTSCPAGVKRTEPEAVAIRATPVPLQLINPLRRTIGELTFVAGFHLTSGDARFGGLSGLDVLSDGNLLAVSDQGDFVWIDMAEDGLTPEAARIASMRNAAGEPLRGKADGDSEGLAVNGEIALVSYERNHRVLAFDLGGCGAAARGAPIAFGPFGGALPDVFVASRIDVGENSGPEPLAVTQDWFLLTGLETRIGNAGPLSARPIEARPNFDVRIGAGLAEFVGLDVIEAGTDRKDVRAFSLHRSLSPLSDNAITIAETRLTRFLDQSDLPRRFVSEIDERSHYRYSEGGTHKLADLNVLLNIDNFEGIAAKEMPDGRVRLYIISDNNFSAAQRTLLMVFDTAKK